MYRDDNDDNRHLRRISIAPGDAPLVDDAERRARLFRIHEFKIRMVRREADLGDDLIVLLLDHADALAREISAAYHTAPDVRQLGQPRRPGDDLEIISLPYSRIRHLFSPNNRAILDRAGTDDIRAALMSNGRTLVATLPGDCRFGDVPVALIVQTEADRKVGRRIPDEILDAIDRRRDDR
jgi:hypothetical protein